MTTKEKIIEEALTLFSTKGFHAVTVEEIAMAVGIKAPSIYKHYKSKKSIFHAILEEMQNRYLRQMEQLQMNGVKPEKDNLLFEHISEEQLLQIGHVLFSFFLHDEYNRKFRKLLIIEQFKNETISDILVSQYFDQPIHYQETIFSSLIRHKMMKDHDPKLVAVHFYAPIYYLIALCDAQPKRETEAYGLLEKHIQQFNQIYRIEGVGYEETAN